MKRTALAALIIVAACGCTEDPKAKMRRAMREYNDASDLFATIKDSTSLEAAKPKLRKHFDWVRAQNRQNKAKADANKKPSNEDMQRGMKEFETLSKEPEFKELMTAMQRYVGEMLRVMMAVPGFQQFYTEEMARVDHISGAIRRPLVPTPRKEAS
ncbi:MAG: hypothetical protein ACJ8F7_11580 [Gemmataceae bacterium]